VALAQQYGKTLASAVERVLHEEMHPLSPQITTAYSEIDLTFADPTPTKEELIEITGPSSEYPEYLQHSALVYLDQLEKGNPLISSYPYPVQVWRLGEQPIISLGGEVVVGYSIALKKMFGQNIFVMGYSNDVMAYIPTETVLIEGGYEGSRSPIFTTPWASNIEDRILEEVSKLAAQTGIIRAQATVSE